MQSRIRSFRRHPRHRRSTGRLGDGTQARPSLRSALIDDLLRHNPPRIDAHDPEARDHVRTIAPGTAVPRPFERLDTQLQAVTDSDRTGGRRYAEPLDYRVWPVAVPNGATTKGERPTERRGRSARALPETSHGDPGWTLRIGPNAVGRHNYLRTAARTARGVDEPNKHRDRAWRVIGRGCRVIGHRSSVDYPPSTRRWRQPIDGT